MRLPGQLCSDQRLWRLAILRVPVSDAVVLARPGAGEIGRLAGFAVASPERAAWRSCEPAGHGWVSDPAGAAAMGVTADVGPIAGG